MLRLLICIFVRQTTKGESMIPPAILPYFWLLSAAVMLVSVALVHRRARILVRRKQVSEAERRAFSRGAALVVLVFCLLLQAIVWLTGEGRPECLAAFPPNTAASWAGSVVTLGAWSALLWWVWRGTGAVQLARFGPAFMPGREPQTSYSPAQVRRAITAIVVLATLGGAIASQVAPPPSDCGRGGSAI